MILVSDSSGEQYVEVGGVHRLVMSDGQIPSRCLSADDQEAVFVRIVDGIRVTISVSDWGQILDLRPDNHRDDPAARQTDPVIADLFRIADRWERGESPTDAEFDTVYDKLADVMGFLADYQDMIRRRDAHIARLTGNPIQDSLA